MTDVERRLRQALRDQRAPEEPEAERRAWRVVSAVWGEGALTDIRHGRSRRRAAQAAIAVALVTLVASPAGASVRRWIADRIAPGVERAKPALNGLPGSGALLVQAQEGPWIVHPDGRKRLLGAFSEPSWSPHGLFVVATTRHELAVIEPSGTVRWTVTRSGPLRFARWNGPDGYRIAYLDGRTLRVIDGNGAGDRVIARRVNRVAPAWKRGADHVLAYVTARGAVEAISADTRIRLFRTAPATPPISLQWVAGRLLVTRADGLQLLDASGRSLWRWASHPGAAVRSATVSPQGEEIATVVHRANTSRLLLLDRTHPPRSVFAGPGRFSAPVWSPDGRWLLLPWPSADQWLFLSPRSGSTRLHAVANVAAQFAPGAAGRPRFPAVAGWCCSP